MGEGRVDQKNPTFACYRGGDVWMVVLPSFDGGNEGVLEMSFVDRQSMLEVGQNLGRGCTGDISIM